MCAFIDEERGGSAQVTEDDYLDGAPELIVEVAASRVAYDLHDELHVYRRNRVQEYLVLMAHEQKTVWYAWQEGEYHPLQPDDRGILRSQVFPGLHFQPSLFWAGDLSGLLNVLHKGLGTSEHATFVDKLRD